MVDVSSLLDRLADASIFFSFDASGYRRHEKRFRAEDLAVDMSGKVCLVTGASSGLGLATSAALARLGATVHLLCRSAERGSAAAETIAREVPGAKLLVDQVDLTSRASIRAFVDRFAERRVDVLIHNAGILPPKREEVEGGLELTFATHVMGPFLLTTLLLPRLFASPRARVLWVSSGGMYTKKLALDDVAWKSRSYDGVLAYAETKRMQVILSELWAAKLAGSRVVVHAMHPGWADTPGVQTSLTSFSRVMHGRLRTPAQGADTVVWLAASPTIPASSGRFWFDRREASTHLLPGTREAEGERARLWDSAAHAAGLSAAEVEAAIRARA